MTGENEATRCTAHRVAGEYSRSVARYAVRDSGSVDGGGGSDSTTAAEASAPALGYGVQKGREGRWATRCAGASQIVIKLSNEQGGESTALLALCQLCLIEMLELIPKPSLRAQPQYHEGYGAKRSDMMSS